MMPRRKSRYVLLIAFVMAFMLYQFFKTPEWDATGYVGSIKSSDPEKAQNANKEPAKPPTTNDNTHLNNNPPPDHEHPHDEEEDEPEQNPHKQTARPTVKIPQIKSDKVKPATPTEALSGPTLSIHAPNEAVEATKKPDVTKAPTIPLEDDIHAKNPPGRLGLDRLDSELTSTSQIHWHKVSEHFPVPTDEIIPLPTGKPKDIPKVQYAFKPESDSAKEKRESRLALIKAEMERSWAGYRKFAWMHDELSPVSGRFRDPFCGWAATLVDGLDTLWIMGMKEEFDAAAKAVKDIDFTYSPTRRDIPVFETIIRYLGGLLAAYDVSGGREGDYKLLLDKAVELAEILMGVFDTPNRMPILYYNWQPQYASQPHRATTVGVAELGSMSMEFTRLAQLTGEDKYYDAIARITDAFEDLQNRGTTINGIFPEQLDASGCNRTAEAIIYQEEQAAAASASAAAARLREPKGHEPASNGRESDEISLLAKRAAGVDEDGEPVVGNANDVDEKQTIPELKVKEKPRDPGNSDRSPSPTTPDKSSWDCIKQGLAPGGWGYEQYSMGGSQDSTYEYFPKEYLVLGGLEPKYKTMHIKTVEAVKKWLLYRPMVPKDRDILFSAKLSTSGDPENDLRTEYEVTHLTCFIGGMFGLGGKIFDRPEDIEVAKKLTDGCVWAYESMPSGIMPEGATVVPCASTQSCPWNETLWWQHLDPSADWRQSQVKAWEERQSEKKQQQQDELRKQSVERGKTDLTSSDSTEESIEKETAPEKKDPLADIHVPKDEPKNLASAKKTKYPAPEPGLNKSPSNVDEHLLKKRDPAPPTSQDPRQESAKDTASNSLKNKLDLNSAEDTDSGSKDASVSGGIVGKIRIEEADEVADPKPQSHEEYIKEKLEREKIPPGFVDINARRYILRPEAIESVWYMYRITGDPEWQEKGWRMWEAIIKATRTEYGNSAVDDVLSKDPSPVDEMESFWVAETLKYFYLLFSTPDVISLDDWVLNTEAHPFKRPV
ncbi:glycosyl hydrolase family 47 [Colletotrichum graminicola]|uniref:alpha-1,2-Mannosidase n=1 Tax=Colletotrichum graminicola (strain M1.001 / M2 / FGSC 10212) TaxID=645133 RepID=E3Q8Z2_COLGM|nr:glycosyl hydrolase family 47 [Colletotrichum graminicola M1.001]EFQ27506.1 glycosyl hydrolase family 47 [Colletotrichum graminicola M1.001]WDK13322.1 glycosyl hydrolase family 47 [Colletotrichum graminicola]